MKPTPMQKIIAAMPGTLPEIVARTEYPVRRVLALITLARESGVRVNAVRDVTRDGSVGPNLQPEVGVLTTVYEVDEDGILIP